MTDPVWNPTAALIPRIDDAMSFIYLDRLKVTQDDTGVLARKYERGNPHTLYLPVAQIATVPLPHGVGVNRPDLPPPAAHSTLPHGVGVNRRS